MSAAEAEAWLNRLAVLDEDARVIELDSLPDRVRRDLASNIGEGGSIARRLSDCSASLRRDLRQDPAALNRLRARAVVPEDYVTAYRVFGLYPLTALAVQRGVRRWHAETYALFARDPADLPVAGALRRFVPPEPETAAVSLPLPRDALGIPQPSPEVLNRLFARHAPIWEIDVAGDYDLPGTPLWREGRRPSVDPTAPVTFRYVSFTRWRGEALLQLNYLIWFSRRPRDSTLGLYGGDLDGVIWRVTLDGSGTPLLYDSIHACGCYHQFFPGPALQVKSSGGVYSEAPLVPQAAPAPGAGERVVVRLDSGRHYIQRVYADKGGGTAYAWRDYRALYGSPMVGGAPRSLFGAHGIVPGSERRERWLLWPTGVRSPGAMRERGHHATAFVGRRHFDDAHLIDALFERALR